MLRRKSQGRSVLAHVQPGLRSILARVWLAASHEGLYISQSNYTTKAPNLFELSIILIGLSSDGYKAGNLTEDSALDIPLIQVDIECASETISTWWYIIPISTQLRGR